MLPETSTPPLYLASASPRRREILHQLGYAVHRIAADIDETPQPQEAAAAYTERLAREKNAAACDRWQAQHGRLPDWPVLSADTTVALAGRILGKPVSAAEARAMLQALSGRIHQVHTAVCVHHQGRLLSMVQSSDVHFTDIGAAAIDAYIASGEPMDKAGAYGIQGAAGVWVRHLSGSFTGVMGLPVHESCTLLAQIGYPVPPFARAPA